MTDQTPYLLPLGMDGSVALPAHVLSEFGVAEGDTLTLLKRPDGYWLVKAVPEESEVTEQRQKIRDLFGTVDMDSEEEMRAQRKRS